jgi:hypothetical protein
MIIFESKWMIYGCALALVVGAALVSPLLILNTVIDPFPEKPQMYPNPQSSNAQIAVNVKSVNVELGTITLPIDIGSTETVTQPAFSGEITVSATKYLNNNESIPQAEADYFLMQFFTENGTLIRNETLNIGTAYNRSFTSEKQQWLDSYQMWKIFGNYGGGGGTFFTTWSIGTTHENRQGFNGNIKPSLAELIDSSQTLTMTLSRIGTVTVRDDDFVSVWVTNAGFIENVTLTRSGNTFTSIR